MKLFCNLFFCFLFLLAAVACFPGSARAARWTEIYNPRFWGTAAVGSYAAPTNLTIATTTGGVYTNFGITNAWYYRIYGTNSLGRTPVAQTNIIFAENTNASAVSIGWDRLDGISGYVLEKSYDGGTNWTNHFHYAASATNASDWQYSSFADGSNSVAEIPSGAFIFLTNEPTFLAWLTDNTYVKSNTGNWAGTWMGLTTNSIVTSNNATYTDTVAKASAAYPASNPSNYVTSTVTNGVNARIDGVTNGAALGETAVQPATLTAHTTNTIPHVSAVDRTNWDGKITLADVAGAGYLTNVDLSAYAQTNDPAMTNARPPTAHDHDYTAITNPPWITNAGSADISGWSTNLAVSVITWAVTNLAETNLVVSGGLTPADAEGTYTRMPDSAGLPAWRKGDWYIGCANEVQTYFALTPSPTYAPLAETAAWWTTAETTNSDIVGNAWEVYTSAPATGTPTMAYSQIETWRAGATATEPDKWRISVNGNYLFTVNKDGTLPGWTNMTLGITAGTAYDGAQGHSVSGQVAVLLTNTAPLQSYLATSGTVSVLATNTMPLQDGIAASNLAYAASTNAEAARVIATNALDIANAALPASSTNNLSVTALRITGGSPTNGAMWIATNENGTGRWSVPVGFQYTATTALTVKNNIATNLFFATKNYDLGNNFDGTTFVAPVGGFYIFTVYWYWERVSGTADFVSLSDGVSAAQNKHFNAVATYAPQSTFVWLEKLTNNQPVTFRAAGCTAGTTNTITSTAQIIGTLVRELP